MAKRVLVVDDNVDVIKMVGLMLESVGYEIIAAQSGEQPWSSANGKARRGDSGHYDAGHGRL